MAASFSSQNVLLSLGLEILDERIKAQFSSGFMPKALILTCFEKHSPFSEA